MTISMRIAAARGGPGGARRGVPAGSGSPAVVMVVDLGFPVGAIWRNLPHENSSASSPVGASRDSSLPRKMVWSPPSYERHSLALEVGQRAGDQRRAGELARQPVDRVELLRPSGRRRSAKYRATCSWSRGQHRDAERAGARSARRA